MSRLLYKIGLFVRNCRGGRKKKKPREPRLPCYEVHLSINTPLVLEDKHADGGEERGDADPHAYLPDAVVVVG